MYENFQLKTKSVVECHIQREFTLFQPHFDFKEKNISFFTTEWCPSNNVKIKKKKGAAGYFFFIKTKIINKYTGLFYLFLKGDM